MTVLRCAWHVAAKDLRTELRAPGRMLAMLAFTALAAFLFGMTLDRARVEPAAVAGPFLWLVMLFSATAGASRAFDAEDEDGAFRHLLLAPAPRSALFLGKTGASAILVAAAAAAAFVAFVVFLGVPGQGRPAAHAGVLLPGAIGLAAAGTFFGRMAGHSSLGDALLPVLLFPLLAPVVFFGATATGRLLSDRPWPEVAGLVRLLWACALAALAAGGLLFRHVVDD